MMVVFRGPELRFEQRIQQPEAVWPQHLIGRRNTGVSMSDHSCSLLIILVNSCDFSLQFLGRGHVRPEWVSPVGS